MNNKKITILGFAFFLAMLGFFAWSGPMASLAQATATPTATTAPTPTPTPTPQWWMEDIGWSAFERPYDVEDVVNVGPVTWVKPDECEHGGYVWQGGTSYTGGQEHVQPFDNSSCTSEFLWCGGPPLNPGDVAKCAGNMDGCNAFGLEWTGTTRIITDTNEHVGTFQINWNPEPFCGLFGQHCPASSALVHTWALCYGYPDLTSCSDDYVPGYELYDTTVDATDEDGNAHLLRIDSYYQITTGGGPWHSHSGGIDRYDIALSYDRENWTPLQAVITDTACVSTTFGVDYASLYFQAESNNFYVRVNDVTGAFMDNTGSMGYSISGATYIPGGPSSCGDDYDLDAMIREGESIPANDPLGERMPPLIFNPIQFYFTLGEYYAVEILSPPYLDGGVPTYTVDLAKYPGEYPDTWTQYNNFGDVTCVEEVDTSGRYRFYFNASSMEYYMRASAGNGSWGDNTGNVTYNLLAASYAPEPPVSACESNYDSRDQVAWGDIDPTLEDGQPLSPSYQLLVDRYYMIETRGGPWYDWFDGGEPSFDLDISSDNGTTWSELTEFARVECLWEGTRYVRIYFKVLAGDIFKIRVHDDPGEFDDNTGTMHYNLYLVNTYVAPTCDDYQMGKFEGSWDIQADDEDGEPVPLNGAPRNPQGILSALVPGDWYAIETIGGPWYDGNEPEPLYSMDISDNGGYSWILLDDYAGVACQEEGIDENHIRVYFRAVENNEYRLRIHDEAGNFVDNVGSMGVNLYHATVTNPGDPCDLNFVSPVLISEGEIDATLEGGVTETLILPGIVYRLDTKDGPWLDNAVESYDVDISDNGGSTWSELSEYSGAICNARLAPYYDRVYFTAGTLPYKLRVHDDPGNYGDNSGSMGYALYTVKEADPGDGTVPGFDGACELDCERPSGIINIPGWLEYGRCSFMKWISWCPHHSERLIELRDYFEGREPFGTFLEVGDAFEVIRLLTNEYDWDVGIITFDGAGKPSQIESVPNAMTTYNTMFVRSSTSPYMTGGNAIMITNPNSNSYSTDCTFSMEEVVGDKMARPMCFSFDVLIKLGLMDLLQVFITVASLAMLFYYVQHKWLTI